MVETYRGWHAAFFESSSLPAWLQDVLVNSMSNWRSAFMTADGRWRQWEAYDCVDVDSVHNDYQRQMPYALFFPDLVKNVMTTGWAKLQQADGMITESLSGGWALPQISLRCTMRRLTATQGRPLWHQLACDIWSRRSRRYCSM